jgi:quercetin dioxygenase-like cupin family protein
MADQHDRNPVRPIARYDKFASSLSWEATMLKWLVFCAALAAGLCGGAALAQQGEPIKRTELQRLDSPGDKMATLLMLIEIAPNALVPRHTHPGGEVGYVLDGTVEFDIAGQPAKTFKQGDTYRIPVSAPHTAKAGFNGAKLLGTFVVEKDKPIASPAP